MKKQVYHVGMFARKQTAVFQYRSSVDYLSCELLEYYGQREVTIVEAKKALKANKEAILKQLNSEHPKHNFKNVVIN